MTVTGNTTDSSEFGKLRTKIRMLLRDHADVNILLNDVDFTLEEYACAIELATDGYNVMTPITALDPLGLPPYVLVNWAAGLLLRSQTFLQARNQVSVPTDNIGVIGIDDKAGLYDALSQGLIAEAKGLARTYKNQQNAESGYGGLPSGYSHVSRFNQT